MELIKKIVIGLIIYALLSIIVIVFLKDVLSLDNSLFLFVSSFSNVYLDMFFLLVTYVGSSVFWVLTFIIFWTKNRKVSAYLFIAFIIDTFSQFLLKTFFIRLRPYEVFSGRLLAFDIELGASFPSGHTQRAFSGSVILGSFYKKYRIPLFALAVLVAISRIYIGVHYPLDTLAGAINGLLFGMIVLNIPLKKL